MNYSYYILLGVMLCVGLGKFIGQTGWKALFTPITVPLTISVMVVLSLIACFYPPIVGMAMKDDE